jgi:apolipoprotein N-acyltransferase
VQADLLARVRAYENRVPFIAANKCGSELAMVAYCGKSQIVDSGGEIVALASERAPETLHAAITLAGGRPPRVAQVRLPVRQNRADAPLRLAIAYESLPNDIDERLDLLDDAFALSSADLARRELLDQTIPLASVVDETVLDPGGLVPYRRAGCILFCWTTVVRPPWLERIARARAVELRVYLVVFDRSAQRAFAVDPDGTIVAGTFDEYRLASFTFDPRKTAETIVAPGTDVAEGLDRIEAIVADV